MQMVIKIKIKIRKAIKKSEERLLTSKILEKIVRHKNKLPIAKSR
jgi:hypothetical protein